MTQPRFDKLNASLNASGLDAVILNPGPTLTYLTGLHFHLMERPVVLFFAKDQDPALVLPELELQKVAALPYQLQVFAYPENPAEWDEAFRKAVQALGLDGKRIGVEPRQLRLLEFRHVKNGAPEADYPDGSEALSAFALEEGSSGSGGHAPRSEDRPGGPRSDPPFDQDWHDREGVGLRVGGATAQARL